METASKTNLTLIGLTAVFLVLAMAFYFDFWGRYEPLPVISLVDPAFTNTATVRASLAELVRTGGDTSSFSCNSCHEENKPGKLEFDAEGHVVLPSGHQDLVMQHGRNKRNDNCFTCHDQTNYAFLKRADGRKLKLEESTLLCAGCHGPTYRDWGAGIHGRTSGYWKRDLGPIVRKDCTDCHNPHAPAFPSLKPAPGPHALHPKPGNTQ